MSFNITVVTIDSSEEEEEEGEAGRDVTVRPVCTVGQQQHWTKTGTKTGGGQRAETYSSTVRVLYRLLVQWNAGREV